MDRKQFIKTNIALGIGLTASKIGSAFPLPTQKEDEHHRVIVIGTGYGAAVAALRLAEKGIKVIMLEMGMDWPARKDYNTFSKLLFPDKRSTWLKTRSILPFANIFTFKKYTGVLDRMDFDGLKVYAGRGVGGGSLVNGGMAVVPKRTYFEQILPAVNANEMYDKYFPLANRMLKVNSISPAFFESTPYYKFTRTARDQAHAAGYKTTFVPNVYDFGYMEKESRNEVYQSALNGEVVYGNNAGKQSLDKTYLAAALKTGNVEIRPLHQVNAIFKTGTGYKLVVDKINTGGHVDFVKDFHCDYLFVCAGSIGTSQLMVKAKATGALPELNNEIGEGWGNNGNVMAGRNFIKQGTGSKQSCIPTMAIDDWDNQDHPLFAEISPMPMKMETWTSLYLVITKIPDRGKFIYNPLTNKVSLKVPENFGSTATATVKQLMEKLNHANGGTNAGLLFKKGIDEKICYHPLGGCVLGKATDLYGRFKGYHKLYTCDGSLLPGSTGVNPFVTITAIAERNIEKIIAQDFLS
ncbi:GMC oxidoreductase [Pedobacter cryoconitis]|uniref:Cholesterol oxidase n=1 Tax=Pedobacter cryoconitis TaxID=188932 RepID=A0A7X0MK86_9SPHI|nr:GMC oxidoreductase [Pedobacter cryoconitis]MBB6501934.1 cholesterol oxidase [Pedobacter cryoconitis]